MMNNIKQIKTRVCLALFFLGISFIALHALDNNSLHNTKICCISLSGIGG